MGEKFKDFVSNHKVMASSAAVTVGTALCSVPTFAETTTSAFTITSDMLTPVTSAISSGLTVLVPIGLSVMAAMIGISLIPRIIYKFL